MKCLHVDVPYNDWTLIPLCCIHYPIGEKDLLKRWVDRLRSDPHARGVLLGDSMDEYRTHYRSHIRAYTDDENSAEAQFSYHKEQIRELAKILKPVAKQILGVLRGNHYVEFRDGTNSEQYLCQLLGLNYLGVMSFLRISMSTKRTSRPKSDKKTLKVLLHHTGGSQGGRTTSGDVAALERLEAGFEADIYIAGHTHRRFGWPNSAMGVSDLGEPQVVEKTRIFIRSGGLLKGFRDDNPNAHQNHIPTYAECKCLRPTDLGWIELGIHVESPRVGGSRPHKIVYDIRNKTSFV